jgi:hypothetical protein
MHINNHHNVQISMIMLLVAVALLPEHLIILPCALCALYEQTQCVVMTR